jgi:hypothetical protein
MYSLKDGAVRFVTRGDTVLKPTNILLIAFCLIATPLFSATVYSSGALDGVHNGLSIQGVYAVTDTFTLSGTTLVSGFDFGSWTNPLDTATSVDWSIGTSVFGTDIGSGTGSVSNTFVLNNTSYDVSTSTVSGLSFTLGPGTYWLTLANGVTAKGGVMFWDVNKGSSQAFQTVMDARDSETFDIFGSPQRQNLILSAVPEPGTLPLLAGGMLTLVGFLRRRR